MIYTCIYTHVYIHMYIYTHVYTTSMCIYVTVLHRRRIKAFNVSMHGWTYTICNGS